MAKKLTFPYIGLPIRNPATKILTGTLYRPLIPIQLQYNQKISLQFEALVDSGADKCLFPAEIGEQLGIDFSTSPSNTATGIGQAKIQTFTFPIILKIASEQFQIEAEFSAEIDYPLLGRQGFFDQFAKIEFDQKNNRLQLTSN